eukprot:EST43819.1 Hypothetical protein SS50377_16440 [Spironucleus salmonicida]
MNTRTLTKSLRPNFSVTFGKNASPQLYKIPQFLSFKQLLIENAQDESLEISEGSLPRIELETLPDDDNIPDSELSDFAELISSQLKQLEKAKERPETPRQRLRHLLGTAKDEVECLLKAVDQIDVLLERLDKKVRKFIQRQDKLHQTAQYYLDAV